MTQDEIKANLPSIIAAATKILEKTIENLSGLGAPVGEVFPVVGFTFTPKTGGEPIRFIMGFEEPEVDAGEDVNDEDCDE